MVGSSRPGARWRREEATGSSQTQIYVHVPDEVRKIVMHGRNGPKRRALDQLAPNANSELRWIFDFSENIFFVATSTESVRALPPGYWRTTYSARSVGGPLLSALCMYRLSLYDSTTLPSWTSLRALLSSHSPEAPRAQRSVSLPVDCAASCRGLGVADVGMAVGRGQAVGWCGWCGWCGCGGGVV